MNTCDIAIPIRRIDLAGHQVTGVTCMRCGRPYQSTILEDGMLEHRCACGLAYRGEILTPEVITCGTADAAANQAPFWQ